MVKPKPEPPIEIGDIIQWNQEAHPGYSWASFIVTEISDTWFGNNVNHKWFKAIPLDYEQRFDYIYGRGEPVMLTWYDERFIHVEFEDETND